ncbi:MAG: copper chaperone PCu(A)C [Gammaproteobacteria bacterium]|nr:copper chaperone PCu(A)C [Gammaproteobacteria bacterium]
MMAGVRPGNIVHAFLCLLALSGFVQTGHADTIAVHDPWIRAAPPGAPMAGYMVLYNHGAGMKTLVGASSEAFEKIMLHRSLIENGVAKMEHVHSVPVGPGDKVRFEPGGLHLMLMQARETFRATDVISISLEFDNGSTLETRFTVHSPGTGHGNSTEDHIGH